jgi:hypothetical protein
MKIKDYIFFLTFCSMLFSCTRNINSLDKQKVHFDELPLAVQDTLIMLSTTSDGGETFIIFEKDKYDTKSLEWKRGPFTDGYMFTDNEKRKKYKINQGVPFPYIIYNNFLYHPLNFNLFTVYRKNIRNEMFMKYALDAKY